MNVRLKKLQSETIRLIQNGDASGSQDQGTTPVGSSLSRFNFKERLMSPENVSGLVSPTANGGGSAGGVQEVIQLIQKRKISGLGGLGSPNNG